MHVYAYDSISVTDEITEIAAQYSPVPPWQEQWRRVEQRCGQVEAIYGGTASGSIDTWRDTVLDFCVAVHHLHDHIGNDPNEPGVSLRTAEDWVHNHSDLKLAVAVSNTHKHHTRRQGFPARVGRVIAGSARNSVQVEWRNPPMAPPSHIDALVLVDRCMQACRAFFVAHNLDPDA